MLEQDSTSSPALRFLGALLAAVMQKETSVVSPGNINTNYEVEKIKIKFKTPNA